MHAVKIEKYNRKWWMVCLSTYMQFIGLQTQTQTQFIHTHTHLRLKVHIKSKLYGRVVMYGVGDFFKINLIANKKHKYYANNRPTLFL
jgi:hypothetical protein